MGDDGAVDDGAGGIRRGGLEVEDSLADFLAGEVEDWEGGELSFDGEDRVFGGFGKRGSEREEGWFRGRGEDGGGEEGERWGWRSGSRHC